MNILVADDHDLLVEGLRMTLETQPGWKVCATAETGIEAIEKTRLLKPEIVIMDFLMPVMNGLEATRRIRQEHSGTQVLMLTMWESKELAEQAFSAGALGFLLKTNAARQIITAVKAVSESKHYLGMEAVSKWIAPLQPTATEPLAAMPASGQKVLVTPREKEILNLIAKGQTSKEIAAMLGVSPKTVEAHRANLMKKFRVRSASQLVASCMQGPILT